MTATLSPIAANTDVGETIGGKLHGRTLLADTAGVDAMGVVGATPDANTLLGRVKAIVTAITDRLPTLGAKAAAGSVSMVPATDATFATDGAASTNVFDITPHATNPLGTVPRVIYVGSAGDITLRSSGGAADVLFKAVPAGTMLPVRAQYVRVAGTTATNLLGFA